VIEAEISLLFKRNAQVLQLEAIHLEEPKAVISGWALSNLGQGTSERVFATVINTQQPRQRARTYFGEAFVEGNTVTEHVIEALRTQS